MDESKLARFEQLLDGTLDWDFVQSYAEKHNLVPLLSHHLNAQAREKAPPIVYEKLRNQFRRISAWNVYLSGELCRLLTLFASHKIDAIPYKGPALGAHVYGNASLRPCRDLDILVRRCDVLRAKDLLIDEEFALLPPLEEVQLAMMLRTQYHLPFLRDARRMVVELHWQVSARLFAAPLDSESLWQRSGHADFAGITIKTLAPEDLLLSLCVHGTKHMWEKLSWAADIAQLLEVERALNWQPLLERAQRTGTERMLLLGLYVAHDLLDAPLPLQVWERAQSDPEIALLAKQIYGRLFEEDTGATGMSGYFRFQFKARRRLRDKFSYCRYVLSPTEEDLTLLSLPAPLSFVYYLLRPLRLLRTGGPSHFQH
jgi:hypothetical protein